MRALASLMSDPVLGTLQRLDAREVWKNEPYDFTPWLLQHIHLLGQAVGLEIDVEVQQEVAVGLFSADLLGTDIGSSASVLIENQLEQTDHSHLGQLLTYAGGLDTKILIWVSTKVREEHRQALIWLNESTHEDIAFFGVEIELLRIDGSNPAPHFKVVVAPNEWQKSQGGRGGAGAGSKPSERNERYREFWSGVIGAIKEREPTFTTASADRAPRQNWCGFSVGRTGFGDNLTFGWEEGQSILRAEIYIDTGTSEENKAAFDALHHQREPIENEFGEPLIWTRRDDIRASRIYVKRVGALDDSADALEDYRSWFVERALALKKVFAARIKAIDLTEVGSTHGIEPEPPVESSPLST